MDKLTKILFDMPVGELCTVEATNDSERCRDYTEALCVPGGWIFYRHIGTYDNVVAVFVPASEPKVA